jgi:hypothetical protein
LSPPFGSLHLTSASFGDFFPFSIFFGFSAFAFFGASALTFFLPFFSSI